MIESVFFNALAESELNDAARYYESQIKGLGVAFLDEVEHSIKTIQQNPESFPAILKVIRRKTLHRFPYSIMYSFESNSIRILAVANQKRRPFYWRSRK